MREQLAGRDLASAAHHFTPGTVPDPGRFARSSIDLDDATLVMHTLGRTRIAAGRRSVEVELKREARTVMVYLALHAQHGVHAEELMRTFWRNHCPESARSRLKLTLRGI